MQDGTLRSGTPNVTTTPAAAKRNDIVIAGEHYNNTGKQTVITPSGILFRTAVTEAGANGQLSAKVFDNNLAAVADNFSFTIYKL